MPPVVRDTLSLRPSGFYAYAFLAARLVQIVALAVVTGLAGHFLFVTTRGRQPPPANLIVIILFSSAALIWTLFSWTGYSRRYLPYAATWCTDLVFLAPCVAITIVLGLPMADVSCAAIPTNGSFEITTPPGSSFGRVSFSSDGRASCVRLLAVWVLMIVLCALFTLTALSIGFLDLGERQLRKAIFAVRDEPRGGGGGGFYGQNMSESRGRGFVPTQAPPPRPDWSAPRNEKPGMSEYYDPTAHPRPSVAEDRLNLNRPITVAPPPPRGGNSGFGGQGYDDPLGPPPAARMPRMRPDNGFGLPGNPRAG